MAREASPARSPELGGLNPGHDRARARATLGHRLEVLCGLLEGGHALRISGVVHGGEPHHGHLVGLRDVEGDLLDGGLQLALVVSAVLGPVGVSVDARQDDAQHTEHVLPVAQQEVGHRHLSAEEDVDFAGLLVITLV